MKYFAAGMVWLGYAAAVIGTAAWAPNAVSDVAFIGAICATIASFGIATN